MFVENLSESEYNKFCNETNSEHFLHSINWAKFRGHTNWSYQIIGYKENDNITIAAVILFKKINKLPYKIAYTPRGYIKSNNANEIDFLKQLKKYLKRNNVFVYKIDPNEIYSVLNMKLERGNTQNITRVNELKNYGFKHLGFVNNFEGMQPRHTIRINTKCSYEDVLKRMDAKTRNRVKAKNKSGLVIENGSFDKLDDFMNLLQETSSRDNFTIRDKNYFENMLESFGEDVKLKLAKVDFSLSIEKLSEELNIVEQEYNQVQNQLLNDNLGAKNKKKLENKSNELTQKINKNNKVIEQFKSAMLEYPNGQYIGGSLYICEGDKAWYIYGATSDKFRHMLPSYALVGHMLEECVNNNFEYFDMFGIGGDFDPQNSVYGLYDFKKGFGGENIEFIGEFDLPINNILYFGFDKVYPIIKKMRKKIG